MGQAKARGTQTERIQQALSQPPKQRPMSKREIREFAIAEAFKLVGRLFK
jgi:hypothetical protein